MPHRARYIKKLEQHVSYFLTRSAVDGIFVNNDVGPPSIQSFCDSDRGPLDITAQGTDRREY